MVKSILIKNSKNKKAQVWGMDLVIASIIFAIGIIILYAYIINYTSQTRNSLDELFYEGNLASQLILSNTDNGILTNDKINQTKLNGFDNLSYQIKKSQTGVTKDFYFTFKNLEINGTPKNYIGKENNSNTENLIQITRIVIYKNNPTKFVLYIWT